MTAKKVVLWIAGVIVAAFIGWVVTGILDSRFTPLTEEEIIRIMNNVPPTPYQGHE